MTGVRLQTREVAEAMADWSADVRRLGTAARRLVLDIAPALAETIAFGGLCYFKPGRPYGVIGGHVCGFQALDAELRIGFIHGASLPDPEGLLEGRAKAKRTLSIRSLADLENPAVTALILAAVAHDPGA